MNNNSPKKETQTSFKPYHHNNGEEKKEPITKKDIFVMSFFGFIVAGVVLALIGLVVYGSVTGYISINLPEEKEVVEEELLPVIENTTNETAVVVEIPIVNVTTEVVEPADPCDTDMILALNEYSYYNGRQIEMTLVSDYAVQISVGGSKPSLISVGETLTINRMGIYLSDASESENTATIQVVC